MFKCLLKNEIKAGLKYYLVFFFVMTLIFSATLTIFSAVICIPSQYIEMMEDMFPDGAYVLATGGI